MNVDDKGGEVVRGQIAGEAGDAAQTQPHVCQDMWDFLLQASLTFPKNSLLSFPGNGKCAIQNAIRAPSTSPHAMASDGGSLDLVRAVVIL
jgi:hypothetical protein